MSMNRRTFLASSAALAAAPSLRAAAQAPRKKYRACIIGDTKHGGYGHELNVAFGAREDVEVVGLADPDEAGRAKRAAEAKAQRTYADYREMLDKEKPDLAIIGPRWNVRHKEYFLACVEAGAHGFIEKPLCMDLEEADTMLAAAAQKNLKWAIAFNVRALPIIAHARKMIWEEGIIGTVLEARARGKEDHRAGGEDLIVLGVHTFDLMLYLMRETPSWCSAHIDWQGKPATPADVREATEPLGPIVGDTIHATYGFGRGAVGHFDSVKNPEGNRGGFSVSIFGTRGVVSVRFSPAPSVLWLEEPTWGPGRQQNEWKPLPGAPQSPSNLHGPARNQPIVDSLMAAIEEDGTPQVSIKDGRNAQAMIQAVFESHVQGRKVAMPLKNRAHPLRTWGA